MTDSSPPYVVGAPYCTVTTFPSKDWRDTLGAQVRENNSTFSVGRDDGANGVGGDSLHAPRIRLPQTATKPLRLALLRLTRIVVYKPVIVSCDKPLVNERPVAMLICLQT